jgi:serine/threonine protein kinase
MNAELERQVERIFHDLADMPPAHRERVLSERCGDSSELRARVARLLAHHDAAHDPGLRTPVFVREPVPPAASPLPRYVGPYEILKQLGEGGMGVVYLAEQRQPIHRRVALKVIKLGMDTQAVMARFEAEREALALMNHPHVARVIDAGATEQGRPYFVMEYVEGVPINQFCDQQRLTLAERLHLFMQVCQVVQHAHQKGIIHRDLKPSNILVSVESDPPLSPLRKGGGATGRQGVVKVIDFGIAKATQQKLTDHTFATEQGVLVGTPSYMSPEQADPLSRDIDTRTDIYSLGVILYELLVGVLPVNPDLLRRAALSEVQRLIREVDPPKPSSRVSDSLSEPRASTRGLAAVDEREALPHGRGSAHDMADRRKTDPKSLIRQVRGDLDWIVMKCLEKDRTRRYETANALVMDLQRYLNHEPVSAGPPSRSYRIRKFVRRNKGAVTAAALVAFALTGGLVSTSVMFARARSAEERERAERMRAEEGEAVANKARARSEQALGEAEQVTQFLTEMISAADPWEQRIDVTVREVLDRSAATAGEKFSGKPLLEARVQRTLGQTYFNLGLLDLAQQHVAQAAVLYARELGREDPSAVNAANTLAQILKDQGRFSQAEAALRSTLEIQRRLRGDENLETLRTQLILAVDLGRQGRYAEAEELYRKTLEVRLRVTGEEHLDTVACMEGLGISLSQQGRYLEGETYFRKALETLQRFVRQDHPDILGVMGNLANNLNHQGRLSEAEDLFRSTLEMKRRVLGANHQDAIATLQGLARNLEQQGRFAESEEHFRQTIVDLTRVLGAEHDQTLWSMHHLASTLLSQGRYAQAEELYRKTLEARRRVLGQEHPKTLNTVNGLAACLQAQGRYDEADGLYRSAWNESRRILGEDHPSTLSYGNNLAGNLSNQDRNQEAEELLRATLEVSLRTLGEAHPDTLGHLHSLSACLANQGRGVEAEDLFRRCIEGRRRILGEHHPDLAASLDGLAGVLEDSKEWSEAEALCREADSIYTLRLPPEHRYRRLNANLLGAILCGLGRYSEAEPLLVESYEALRDDAGVSRATKGKMLARLISLYEAWDSTAPAGGHAASATAYRGALARLNGRD